VTKILALFVDIFDVKPLSVERLITDTFNGSVTPPPVEFIVVTPPVVLNVMFVPAARLFAMLPFKKSLLITDALINPILPVLALRVDMFDVVEFKKSVVIRDELMVPILPVLMFAVEAFKASPAILTEKFPE
jgi:hypothetical protein